MRAYIDRRIRYSVSGIVVITAIAVFFLLRGSEADDKNRVAVKMGDFVIELLESGEIRAIEAEEKKGCCTGPITRKVSFLYTPFTGFGMD